MQKTIGTDSVARKCSRGAAPADVTSTEVTPTALAMRGASLRAYLAAPPENDGATDAVRTAAVVLDDDRAVAWAVHGRATLALAQLAAVTWVLDATADAPVVIHTADADLVALLAGEHEDPDDDVALLAREVAARLDDARTIHYDPTAAVGYLLAARVAFDDTPAGTTGRAA